MTKPRAHARNDYRQFPPEYIEVLQRFDQMGSIRFGPMTERQANTMRREWHRYIGFLRNAPSDDDFARSLYTIATNMVWSVYLEPDMSSPTGRAAVLDGNCFMLEAYLNPIVATMRGNACPVSQQKEPTQ